MVNYELVNLIVSSISTILAGIAILLYIIMWNKEKESSNYDIFDTTYLDILKTGMEYPKFRNPNYTINYIDNSSSNVTLISPANNSISYSKNNSFKASLDLRSGVEERGSHLMNCHFFYFFLSFFEMFIETRIFI